MTDNLPYRHAAGLTPARHAARSVVMITSPGPEPSLGDVALKLATVCSEVGQRVALVSTAGLGEPEAGRSAADHAAVVEELAVPWA